MTNKLGKRHGLFRPSASRGEHGLSVQEAHAALRIQMLGMDNAYLCLFEQLMACVDEASKRRIAADPEVRRLQGVVEDFRTGKNGGWLGFAEICRPAFDAAQAC